MSQGNTVRKPAASPLFPELKLQGLLTLKQAVDSHAIVSITDVTGCITYVNNKFCEVSGYSREELLGQNHRIVKSDKHSKEFFRHIWRTIAQGNTWQGMMENKAKDGRPYWVQTTIMPIMDDRGKPQQYISIRTDVSATVLTKRELMRFKHILDQTLDCIFIFDAETLRITYVNRGATRQVGYARHELLTMSPLDIKPEYDEAHFKQMLASLQDGEHKSVTFKTTHAHKSGKRIPVEIFLQYHRSNSGVGHFIAVVRDITEHMQMIRGLESLSLAASANNIFADIARTVSESLDIRWTGIGRVSADRKNIETIGFWSDGEVGEPFDYPLAGTPCADVCGDVRPLYVESQVAQLYPQDAMLQHIGAVSYRGEPLLDQEGKEMGVLWAIDDKPCHDSSSQRALLRVAAKRATLELQRLDSEQLLAERNEQLQDTLERISDGFFSLDRDWHFTFLNNTVAQMFGANRLDLKGKSIWDSLPDMVSFFYKPLKKALRSQQSVNVKGYYAPLDAWLDMHAYPSEQGISIYVRDISEGKKLEQERLEMEQRMQSAQKMEAVGQLTAGIAHDFNNILASVMGYTQLAQFDLENTQEGKLAEYLDEVYQASERGRDLVLQMLNFSRADMSHAEPIDPLPLMKDTVKMLQSTLTAGVIINCDCPPDVVPAIVILPVQLQQVVMNLCVNARDAMNDKGQVNMKMAMVTGKDSTCASCHHRVEGDYVELSVSDEGAGMEPHTISKLFEPFFTTKDVDKGTGLGLAVVHGIVHQYGGHIEVDTRPGKGSTFRLLFPPAFAREQDQLKVSAAPIMQPRPAPKGQRILVVDDEKVLANLISELLESQGYRPLAVTDPVDALELFKTEPDAFDLVLTDQTMPGLGGLDLARELLALRPELPVVLWTGYSNAADQDQAQSVGIRTFLHKPLNPQDLLTILHELLSEQEIA